MSPKNYLKRASSSFLLTLLCYRFLILGAADVEVAVPDVGEGDAEGTQVGAREAEGGPAAGSLGLFADGFEVAEGTGAGEGSLGLFVAGFFFLV